MTQPILKTCHTLSPHRAVQRIPLSSECFCRCPNVHDWLAKTWPLPAPHHTRHQTENRNECCRSGVNHLSLISCKVRCCKGSLLTISCLDPHQTLSPKLIVHGHYDHLWSMISLLWSNRVQKLWVSPGVSTCVWLLGGVFRKLDADTAAAWSKVHLQVEVESSTQTRVSPKHSDYWLAVDLPLWKIWKWKLGSLFPMYGKSPCLMDKSTISMAIFNSYVNVYQRVGYQTWLENSPFLDDFPSNSEPSMARISMDFPAALHVWHR